jgi:hypothetical protein
MGIVVGYSRLDLRLRVLGNDDGLRRKTIIALEIIINTLKEVRLRKESPNLLKIVYYSRERGILKRKKMKKKA